MNRNLVFRNETMFNEQVIVSDAYFLSLIFHYFHNHDSEVLEEAVKYCVLPLLVLTARTAVNSPLKITVCSPCTLF